MKKNSSRIYFGRSKNIDSESRNEWLEENRRLLEKALSYENVKLIRANVDFEDEYYINVSIFSQQVSDSRRNSFSIKEYNELIVVLTKAINVEVNKDMYLEYDKVEYLFSLAEAYIKLHQHEQGMQNLPRPTKKTKENYILSTLQKSNRKREYDFYDDTELEKNIDLDLEAEQAEEGHEIEGSIKFYYGKRFERSSKNRKLAIQKHGLDCFVCGFNFEEIYGERGKDFIEVHHINPLSTLGEVIKVNPETDLIPLCANCHRMVHRRKDDVLDLESLKDIL